MSQSRSALLRLIQKRSFRRWLGVMLRTLHLLGVCGLMGGVLFRGEAVEWLPYLQLTLVSGIALMLTEIWENPGFLYEVRGAVLGLKFALLGIMALAPDLALPILIAVVVVSGVTSHAPKNFRHRLLVKQLSVAQRGAGDNTKSTNR